MECEGKVKDQVCVLRRLWYLQLFVTGMFDPPMGSSGWGLQALKTALWCSLCFAFEFVDLYLILPALVVSV